MRYLLLVSHGTFAPGLHSVLDMLVGKRDDILSCSLRDGEGAEEYVSELEQVIAPITADDEVLVLGDLIGGSPLTNALNTLASHGLLAKTRAFGGMNVPMALTAAFDLQSEDLDGLCDSMVSEGQAAQRAVELDLSSDDEDEDL
ncbi:PTS sugar transporter subunit IIA [Olsenella profusa]|uniref:PTS fructose transporter subunit IIA n=1 Tax=Olsenella profusa TaxID=138595 RepID=A0ABS2F238_9ACTN|nr:PTS fructose transporter subunit IIA [Olsenella profusa]MBM6775046.1 PTS fructose transporter subunit IIA [Olsenella profusa]